MSRTVKPSQMVSNRYHEYVICTTLGQVQRTQHLRRSCSELRWVGGVFFDELCVMSVAGVTVFADTPRVEVVCERVACFMPSGFADDVFVVAVAHHLGWFDGSAHVNIRCRWNRREHSGGVVLSRTCVNSFLVWLLGMRSYMVHLMPWRHRPLMNTPRGQSDVLGPQGLGTSSMVRLICPTMRLVVL